MQPLMYRHFVASAKMDMSFPSRHAGGIHFPQWPPAFAGVTYNLVAARYAINCESAGPTSLRFTS